MFISAAYAECLHIKLVFQISNLDNYCRYVYAFLFFRFFYLLHTFFHAYVVWKLGRMRGIFHFEEWHLLWELSRLVILKNDGNALGTGHQETQWNSPSPFLKKFAPIWKSIKIGPNSFSLKMANIFAPFWLKMAKIKCFWN